MTKLTIRLIKILIFSSLLALMIWLVITNTKDTEIHLKPKKKAPVIEKYSASLVMVGDTLIHSTVYKDARVSDNNYDFKPKLADIKPFIKEHDLAFYNQESIIGGKALGLSTYPMFNSPEEIGDDMLDAGFNLVSLANNHTLDRGEAAIINSLNFWKSKDALVAGSYDSFESRDKIKFKEVNNIKFGLLAYTTKTNGFIRPKGKEYYLNIYDEAQVKRDVERLKAAVDVILVSMHWGTEYTHTPIQEQIDIANYLSTLGVDIIIGHHPHVVEPIAKINETWVVYSLGNFLSSQIGDASRIGGMVSFNFEKMSNDTKVSISNPNVNLVYTYYNSNRKNIKLYMFDGLNEELLPGYLEKYNKYANIMKADQTFVNITPLN